MRDGEEAVIGRCGRNGQDCEFLFGQIGRILVFSGTAGLRPRFLVAPSECLLTWRGIFLLEHLLD